MKNIEDKEGEVWKTIKGYEGQYMVSNHGRVYSCERKDSMGRTWGGHLLSPDTDRYARVGLYKDGVLKKESIHRLVANCFLKKPNNPEKTEVNHKDSDGLNNHVSNLEWCTRKENMKHAYAKSVGPIGEINGQAKLTTEEVIEIRSKYQEKGLKQKEISEEYNIAQPTVSEIVNRKKWAWL